MDVTESDLYLSPTFIDFVSRWLGGRQFDRQSWPDQLSEEPTDYRRRINQSVDFRFQRLLINPEAHPIIDKAFAWFKDLATGRAAALEDMHRAYNFIIVVGAPRTGGSYLTSELFAALGHRSSEVPAPIAHDGFPDARPYVLAEGRNSWIEAMMTMSEYLTMLELYFPKVSKPTPITIPKKAIKILYAAGLFKTIFGPHAQYLITVRHPISACISTMDKSGGVPPSGKFRVRSVIENWIRRELAHTGMRLPDLRELDYFDVYVRYWEQFHIRLALSGLIAHRRYDIVAFGRESMERVSAEFRRRLGTKGDPSEFVVPARRADRYADWIQRSEDAITLVDKIWRSVGLRFPRDEIQLCY